MKTTLLFVVLFVSLYFFGCGSSKTVNRNADLAGTEWIVFEMDGNKYESADKISIKFDDSGKKISGKAPCNSYGAGATINSNKVSFTDIYSTKMMCDNMNDEQKFMETLKKVYAYQTANDMLYFLDTGGMVIFRFKAK